MSAAPPGPMSEAPMPPSAELAPVALVLTFMPGNGEGDCGMDAAESVDGSKAGEDDDEMDCLRTDLNASDAEAAMMSGGSGSRRAREDGEVSVLDPGSDLYEDLYVMCNSGRKDERSLV